MEEVRTFLDSSTIHGLAYISSTRKLARVIWIWIVIAGFIGAGILIHTSFQAWADSPVKTTIETLPITEISLPKVTVCPPKNTFTNLNYDLMMLENMTLENDARDKLTQYAVGLIQDHNFKDLISNISLIEEENRYYNWYMGYSMINLPWWGRDPYDGCLNSNSRECANYRLRYYMQTKATHGSFSTKFFGEKFEQSKVQTDFKYCINIHEPSELAGKNNISLYTKEERSILHGFEIIFRDYEYPIFTSNLTTSPRFQWYGLDRNIPMYEVKKLKMNSMPGFRINWSYSELLEPDTYPNSDFAELRRYCIYSSLVA